MSNYAILERPSESCRIQVASLIVANKSSPASYSLPERANPMKIAHLKWRTGAIQRRYQGFNQGFARTRNHKRALITCKSFNPNADTFCSPSVLNFVEKPPKKYDRIGNISILVIDTGVQENIVRSLTNRE